MSEWTSFSVAERVRYFLDKADIAQLIAHGYCYF